jgi:polyhydroxyalkanoate synthesis regulator phasin
MVDKPASDLPPQTAPSGPPAGADGAAPPPPRRPPGHRGADMRDTVAEMAERAQLISQEAGSKVAAAMKDVISAAAGIAGFAIESARDLVQYMVRRGQMTPEEADKLMREAEAAHDKRPDSEKGRPTASKIAAERAAAAKVEAAARAAAQLAAAPPHRHAMPVRPVAPPAVSHPLPEKAPPAKPAPKPPTKSAKTASPAPKAQAKAGGKAAKKAAKPAGKSAKAVKAAKKKSKH